MDRSAGFALRWLRALLLTGVAVASGVVGHVSADGLLPGRGALAALFVVVLLAAAALLGRPASTFRVVMLLVAGQALIHVTLTAMSGHRGDPVHRLPAHAPHTELPQPAGTGHLVGSSHDQLRSHEPVVTQMPLPVPVQHLIADLTGPSALMALAHLAAAAAVGLWLASGEKALWAVLALAADRVCELVKATVCLYGRFLRTLGRAACDRLLNLGRTTAAAPTDQKAPTLLLLARAVVRRGPPPLLAA